MTVKYRTTGLVFGKIDKNESDQTISVFTKDFGRLEITAKAVRKITSKLRAGIDMFYLSEVEFIQGKNTKTLTDAAKIKKFDCTNISRQIATDLDRFVKGQEKDEQTFNLVTETLGKEKNSRLLYQYFFWNFLALQGFRLYIENCATCRSKINPYNIYFSAKDGGVLCKNCFNRTGSCKKINSDVVKILKLIFNKEWGIVSRLRVEQHSKDLLKEVYEDSVKTFCPEYC